MVFHNNSDSFPKQPCTVGLRLLCGWKLILACYLAGIPRRPAFFPGSDIWDLRWTKWRWDRFSSEYFCFPQSVSFPQCSMFMFIFTLLLPEEQVEDAHDFKRNRCFYSNRQLEKIVLHCCLWKDYGEFLVGCMAFSFWREDLFHGGNG